MWMPKPKKEWLQSSGLTPGRVCLGDFTVAGILVEAALSRLVLSHHESLVTAEVRTHRTDYRLGTEYLGRCSW